MTIEDQSRVDIAEMRALMEACTKGDLSTAERHIESEYVECPACSGDGEIEASDYCNFDGKALGVQFYGIGPEFGAHEKLWCAVTAALPALLTELEATRAAAERIAELEGALENILGNGDSEKWMTCVEPLIARFKTSAKFGADAVHNPQGSAAIAELLTSMAGRLDAAVAKANAALQRKEPGALQGRG